MGQQNAPEIVPCGAERVQPLRVGALVRGNALCDGTRRASAHAAGVLIEVVVTVEELDQSSDGVGENDRPFESLLPRPVGRASIEM